MNSTISRLLLLVAGLIFALSITEGALKWLGVGDYDVGEMGPGLLEYDQRLGWKLVPGVEVGHRHQDFDVTYRTDTWGLRRDGFDGKPGAASTWILGDSFTFGIGVEDDETFVARLNAVTGGDTGSFVNFGQIGYATDQSVLLLEKMVEWHGTPDEVLLVVYVGNDLVDNLHAVPTQAPRPKPFFEIESGELSLRGVPVPRSPGRSPSFSEEILGRVYHPGAIERTLSSTKIGTMLWSAKNRVLGQPQLAWSGAFDDQLELFRLLIDRVSQSTTKLSLVLLGGKAVVESPDSFSGQYQNYLRSEIMGMRFPDNVAVHDMITPLQDAFRQERLVLYHPNEGHLSRLGHDYIAKNWPIQANRGN